MSLRLTGARWATLHESAVRTFRAAGWAGVVGVALTVFAVCFDLSGNRALEAQADALEQETRSLRQRLRTHPEGVAVPERTRLERFYGAFPATDALPDLLVRLHGYALARGLKLDRADYRSAPEGGTPLERVTLELPARGPYPVLRTWLADVLAEMPEVALDGLSLRRASMATPEVETQVRFVVFLRRQP
ncbi:MAG TPA: hypothetical protein PK229_01750 [Rhodocyclaceae bacterium]|nr:hypothetical protein [Rhodocyclaceae bacterium]HND23016.1 hypothetical protein [Rhodocyclaceae bacterium]HNI81787.1 hypothetical protein [Rhodocyclaceae bacterium]